MAHKALVVWGGWNGHEPQQVAEICDQILREHGFEVEMSDTLDAFQDREKLQSLDLIVLERVARSARKRQIRGFITPAPRTRVNVLHLEQKVKRHFRGAAVFATMPGSTGDSGVEPIHGFIAASVAAVRAAEPRSSSAISESSCAFSSAGNGVEVSRACRHRPIKSARRAC